MPARRQRPPEKPSRFPLWLEATLVAAGSLVILLGAAEPEAPAAGRVLAALLVVSLLAVGLREWRQDDEAGGVFLRRLPGRLSWVTAAWLLHRLLLPLTANSIVLPMAVVAWQVAELPGRHLWPSLLLALVLEAGLTLGGHQSATALLSDVLVCLFAAFGLTLLVSSRAHRKRMRKTLLKERQRREQDQYARDLGLLAEELDVLADVAGQEWLPDEQDHARLLAMVDEEFSGQLALLGRLLPGVNLVLLWPDQAKQQLRVRAWRSDREDLLTAPFEAGRGVTGVLTGAGNEVAGHCADGGRLPFVPFYRFQRGVGAFLAIRVMAEGRDRRVGFGEREITPILYADRPGCHAWSEEERHLLRLAARKLAGVVELVRRLEGMAVARLAFYRACIGLRELNAVLEFAQVAPAAFKAVRCVVAADFFALSLLEGEEHRLAGVEGDEAEGLRGRSFGREEGLVGQVVRIGRSLPARADCQGPVAVFSESAPLTGYRSLQVLPLAQGGKQPVGALTVASRRKGVLGGPQREILKLIAAQVAVKIDLARAHQQINQMATTDGLTGLKNRRTFQHGFGVMLERARRRQGRLCLLLADIDHFKQINDRYGHPFGDQVLRQVAGVLEETVRSVDLAARYGGEEFALILEDCNGRGGVRMAERIRGAVAGLGCRCQGAQVAVTISLGLSCYPDDGQDQEQLLSQADQALYQAKQQGRNRVVRWRPPPSDEA